MTATGRRRGDGRPAPDAAARGRAVPPRVDPLRARRRAGRELPGAGDDRRPGRRSSATVAAAHPRCFWLDGGGAREWSGRRSLVGWLDDDDVSLTYDAATRAGHPARRRPRARWSATTCSRCSRPSSRPARPTTSGSATSATPAGPTCPRASAPGLPDAVWMRPRAGPALRPRGSQASPGACRPLQRPRAPVSPARPVMPAARLRRRLRPGPGAPARGQLLRGQPDLPGRDGRATSTRSRRTCGCASSTPRRTPGSCSTTCRARGPGCSAPARSGTRWSPPTGRSRPSRSRAPRRAARRPRRTSGCARTLAERPEVPRREPDDRRPAPQRPVDGVRAGHRRGAGADGGRVLRVGAPAGQHGPRPAARRRDHGRRAARALPGRLDDRRPEAAHHADHRGGRGRPRAARTPARSAGSAPTAGPTSAW